MGTPLDPALTTIIGVSMMMSAFLNWRYDLTRRYVNWLSGGKLKAYEGRVLRFYCREFTSAFLVFLGLAVLLSSWRF